jgi:signal transduction histidine kinase
MIGRVRWQLRPEPAHGGDALPEDGAVVLSALALFLGVVCTLVWLLTGGGFWPVWTWIGLGTVAALAPCLDRARRRRRPWILLHAWFLAAIVGCCVAVWLAAGADGLFWPAWVLFGGFVSLGPHAILAARERLRGPARERELAARVDRLEQTRRGALDVQAAELRRIERDLHDGAQARLVALTMRLGRAEARLDHDPEAAELVRAARLDATAAIAELRDLARGIAPPVLADRGLVAASQALGERAPLHVEVHGALRGRLPPVVESAAYFVVSEALTNVAKHAPLARARVELTEREGELAVVVADDGPGGAVATGSGLTGLRQRVAALDGTFDVVSAPGSGTRLEVRLPCGS